MRPIASGAANANPGDADVVIPASKREKVVASDFPSGVDTPLFLS